MILAAVAVPVACGYFIHLRYLETWRDWEARLSSEADDRERVASQWVSERRLETLALAQIPKLRAFLAGGVRDRSGIAAELEAVASSRQYAGICLWDKEERLSFATRGAERLCEDGGKSHPELAWDGRLRIFLRGFKPGDSLWGFSTEVRADPKEAPVGRYCAWISPMRTLFPLLQNEPTPTETGEFALVQLDGGKGEAVYLSPVRHLPAGAAVPRRPLSDPRFAAGASLGRQKSFGAFTDYRGVWTLAAARWMPSTGWGILRQVELTEAFSGFAAAAAATVVFGAILLAALAAGWQAARHRRRSEELSVALDRMEPGEDFQAALDHLLQVLLDPVSPEPLPTPPVDLSAALQGLSGTLRRLAGGAVRVTIEPGAGPIPVRVDPRRLAQALLVLAVKARGSMPEGGDLTFSVETGPLPEELRSAFPEADGRTAVHLRVSLSGAGDHGGHEGGGPFGEPFVYDIVRQLGGAIQAERGAGAGTDLHIYFPVDSPPEGCLT